MKWGRKYEGLRDKKRYMTERSECSIQIQIKIVNFVCAGLM